MPKFYLKKVDGTDDIIKMSNKPIWGKVPSFYRDTDWNIDNKWYKNTGADILTNTDPFGDGSCIRRFNFNGDFVDKVSGTVTAVPNGTHYQFQNSGPFGTKCLTINDAENGVNYVNCGAVTRRTSESFTISGWVRIQDSTGIQNLRNSNGTDKTWIEIWKVDSGAIGELGYDRTPGLYYNTKDGRFNYNLGDNTSIGTYQDIPIEVLGDWIHITQVVNKFSYRFYINGECLIDNGMMLNSGQLENYLGDGTLYLGNNSTYSTNCSYKNIDLFKRALNNKEVLALYNQQLFNETICNGVGTNPKPFSYLSEREKLIRVTTDSSGNIVNTELVRKHGYITTTDNVVRYENGQLLDKYGKNVLASNVNRMYHLHSNTLVSVSANSVWGTFMTQGIYMDTDKYDYVFKLNTTAYIVNNASLTSLMGANFNISIDDTPIVTSGHRGTISFGSAVVIAGHEDVTIVSPRIDRGYKGFFLIRGSLARSTQDSTVCTIENHNNPGVIATAPFNKLTPAHLSTLTVYEINKPSSELLEGN